LYLKTALQVIETRNSPLIYLGGATSNAPIILSEDIMFEEGTQAEADYYNLKAAKYLNEDYVEPFREQTLEEANSALCRTVDCLIEMYNNLKHTDRKQFAIDQLNEISFSELVIRAPFFYDMAQGMYTVNEATRHYYKVRIDQLQKESGIEELTNEDRDSMAELISKEVDSYNAVLEEVCRNLTTSF
jgi:hypothetical protein